MRGTGWQDLWAGPGGAVGVGAGWGSATAWLVAVAVLAVLVVAVWWGVRRGRRPRDRGEELALRRYDLQHPPDDEHAPDDEHPPDGARR